MNINIDYKTTKLAKNRISSIRKFEKQILNSEIANEHLKDLNNVFTSW